MYNYQNKYKPMDDDSKKNPHLDKIEGYWDDILPRLNNLDGASVTQILLRLRESEDSLDRKIWNALYWRINSWMKSFFSRGQISDGEIQARFEQHEVGGTRWYAWLHETYADRDSPTNWQTDDLKFICQQLKER